MNLARRIVLNVTAVAMAGGLAIAASSPPKKEARVTQIIKEVNLLPADGSARPAAQNDEVSENTAVRTGNESRSELTFEDLTITRLGANTIFTFNKAGRSGQLESGAILLRVPKNSGGAEFKTHAVTVGITGTTVIFESTRLGNSKLIVLEGDARLGLIKYPKEFKKIRAGQMLSVPAGAPKVPSPEYVDLDQIAKTHPLLTDFPPLPSDNLIRTAIKKQQTGSTGSTPVTQGTPRITNTPRPGPTFAPVTPTPTPKGTPIGTPKPTGTANPIASATPKPTAPPKPPPKATPKPPPKATPRPSPRASYPPLPPQTGNTQGQPTLSGTPKKKIVRRPTPTPTSTPKIL